MFDECCVDVNWFEQVGGYELYGLGVVECVVGIVEWYDVCVIDDDVQCWIVGDQFVCDVFDLLCVVYVQFYGVDVWICVCDFVEQCFVMFGDDDFVVVMMQVFCECVVDV